MSYPNTSGRSTDWNHAMNRLLKMGDAAEFTRRGFGKETALNYKMLKKIMYMELYVVYDKRGGGIGHRGSNRSVD